MFRLQTLGSLALTDGLAPGVTTQRRRLALLALLAVAGERGIRRDKLVAYLWPDSPSDNARHGLEQLLYALRRQLGDSALLGPDPLRLNPEVITSDVAQFEQAIARGAPAEAVRLYLGPFLDGFYLSDATGFERWAEEERIHLASRYACALECLADAARDGSDHAGEIGWRRSLVAMDRWNGRSALRLIQALASAGDGAGALHYARVYEALLRDELDSVPDPPFRVLVRELRAVQASGAASDAPASPNAGTGASPNPRAEPKPSPADPIPEHPSRALVTPAPHARDTRSRGPVLRRSSRRIIVALASLVTVIAGVVISLIRQPQRPINQGTNPRVVAVLPFRVTGAGPELGYLSEGIVDLLDVKLTGEGGPRALDPRAVLSHWHRALPSPADNLSPSASVDIARGLGAGRLIDGAVIGTARHLVLTAAIFQVPSGAVRARASVAGTADSLPALIDRLAAALLAGEAGRTELATLTSLPALRAYLDGQAALRSGRFVEAFHRFSHALELDSTFALAGIGLGRARFWEGGDDAGAGFRLAWAARDRLSPRDRTMIAPWMVPAEEHLATVERAVAAMPESPEAWYELGDEYYHAGALQGMAAPLKRAAAAFSRALELDSSVAEPRLHLFEIAAADGDTAEIRRLGEGALAADSTNDFADYVRWQMAYTLRDTEALTDLHARFKRMNETSLVQIMLRSQELGFALEDARRAVTILLNRATTKTERGNALLWQYVLAMNSGRPREALAAATERARALDDVSPDRITDALYWQGDPGAAATEVRVRTRRGRVLASDADERRAQYDDICVVQQWSLAHGEHGTARTDIARLRAAAVPGLPAADSMLVAARTSRCADLLEALLATVTRQHTGATLVAQVDSLSRRNPSGWSETFNLVDAQLLEAQGNLPGALAAVRRRVYGLGKRRYLSTYLRVEGHLAARVGDTAGAIRAYEHYLALRANPDPPLRAERDSIRAELAQLVREP
jgi:DNA-binding SARP family transcriptional activator/tetratricopeptide (TPR) repeat protein